MPNTRSLSRARIVNMARAKVPGETGGRGAFTVGIEEEFFLVDARTLAVPRRVDPAVFRRAEALTRGRAKPEFLQAQVEIVSGVHDGLRGARAEMAELREAVADAAETHGLAVLAAGTHPGAEWRNVRQTDAPRYDRVMDQLQMIGRRDLLCGLHVHVALPDPGRRVEIMRRMVPYVPLLLALSTSSPFWAGMPTGMKGYRLAAYNELPRTGLPPAFRSEAEYRTYVDAMARAGAIPDASYLWWAIRASASLPTLELRAPDCCTRLDDAIAIAALYRALARHLYRTRPAVDDMPAVTHALALENMWRAQRYGIQASFVTRDGPEPVAAVLERVLRQVAADAEALEDVAEIDRCRAIVAEGTSADVQLVQYEQHVAGGHRAGLRAVLQWLRSETVVTRTDPDPRPIASPPLLPSHDPAGERDLF